MIKTPRLRLIDFWETEGRPGYTGKLSVLKVEIIPNNKRSPKDADLIINLIINKDIAPITIGYLYEKRKRNLTYHLGFFAGNSQKNLVILLYDNENKRLDKHPDKNLYIGLRKRDNHSEIPH